MLTRKAPVPVMRPYILIILLLGVLLLGACQSRPTNVGLSAGDIVADPASYYGNLVTVSGEIDQVWDERIFSIGGHDFDDDLLVISLDAISVAPGRSMEAPVVRNDIVQVTGTVEPLVLADLEAKYGLQLDEELKATMADRPVVIVGESVAAALSGIIITPRAVPEPPADATLITDLDLVTQAEDQRALTDRLALFRGARVQEVVSENAFWIGSTNSERLFVVLTAPEDLGERDALREGASQTIYGVLRELPGAGLLSTSWKLPVETVEALADHAVYLHAVGADPAVGT